MSSEVETSLAVNPTMQRGEIVRDSSTPLRSARNDKKPNAADEREQREQTFAQHQIDLMVEHFVYRSVEPRKISRVNIADTLDNAIMRHGSAD